MLYFHKGKKNSFIVIKLTIEIVFLHFIIMTTFSRNIIICPHCNYKMSIFQLMSYTTFNADFFSDGQSSDINTSLNGRIIKVCYNCSKEFWEDTAEIIEPNDHSVFDDLHEVLDIYDLPLAKRLDWDNGILNFLIELLNKGFADSKQHELYIRILLWQKINNRYRYSSPFWRFVFTGKFRFAVNIIKSKFENRKYRSFFKDNLKRLINIYDIIDDDSKLYVAEMHREIGNHRKCSQLLKDIKVKNSSYYKILRANKLRKKKVIKLN